MHVFAMGGSAPRFPPIFHISLSLENFLQSPTFQTNKENFIKSQYEIIF